MSAEVLREAAALMRARAEAATPGPWCTEPDTLAGRVWVTLAPKRFWSAGDVEPLFQVRPPEKAAKDQKVADAAHIAAMHPAVALAVADWLESAAHTGEQLDEVFTSCGDRPVNWEYGDLGKALAVAHAYLGSDP